MTDLLELLQSFELILYILYIFAYIDGIVLWILDQSWFMIQQVSNVLCMNKSLYFWLTLWEMIGGVCSVNQIIDSLDQINTQKLMCVEFDNCVQHFTVITVMHFLSFPKKYDRRSQDWQIIQIKFNQDALFKAPSVLPSKVKELRETWERPERAKIDQRWT